MKLAVGVLLLLPFAAGADQIFVDYEGTVSYDDPEIDTTHLYTVGDHVAGRLIIDTAVAQPSVGGPNSASWTPAARSYEPPYPGMVFVPPGIGDGYDSYDDIGICKHCVADGAGGLLDRLFISDDFFHVEALKHDFIDSLGLEQSFDFTAADVSGPGESLSAWWGPFRGEAERMANFTLSHLSMRPGKCFAHS